MTADLKLALDGFYSSPTFEDNPKLLVMSRINTQVNQLLRDTVHALQPDWNVNEIQAEIARLKGRELAGFFKFDTFVYLVRKYVAQWKKPVRNALDKTVELVRECAIALMEHHACLSRRLVGMLSHTLTGILDTRLRKLAEEMERFWMRRLRP